MTDPRVVAAAQADDGSPSNADLIADYERGAEELCAAVAGLTRAQLQERPIAGKWSSLEVVCHVADCEQFLADRMKRTAAMDRPLLMGADGFLYPAALSYQQHDLAEEIQVVDVNRRQMARVLRLLPAEAWQRTAVHSETGLVTLRQLLLHAIRHLRHHVATIQEKRSALQV